MNDALVAGDKVGAMRYLGAGARRKYGPVFDALLPDMAAIVGAYSVPAKMTIGDGLGEYAVARTLNGTRQLF